MELIYKADDLNRAEQIATVLADAGIETHVQGVNGWSLHHSVAPNRLSVWVLNDGDAPRAAQVLQAFFASEAPAKPAAGFKPDGIPVGLLLFMAAVVLGVVLGMLIYGT